MPINSIINRPANSVVERNRTQQNFGSLTYPADLSTHSIVFNFKEYKYGGGQIQNEIMSDSIALPLPNSLQNASGLNISGSELGVMGSAIADIMTGGGGNLLRDVQEQARDAGRTAASMVSQGNDFDYTSVVDKFKELGSGASYFARAGLTTLNMNEGFSVSAGNVVNPHATLVFSGANLKDFSISWELAPRNYSESDTIARIVKTVKRNIHPGYEAPVGGGGGNSSSFSRGLLTYPNMVDIFVTGYDPDHIFQFKTAMVSNFTVDYTPQGHVMNKGRGAGSTPSFVNLSMSFTESEIWTKEDYE